MATVIKLPECKWHRAPKEILYSLPENWHVRMYEMAGTERLALGPERIEAAINNPINSPRIKDLAKGKKEVVIVFDDMTRVTRVGEIVPFVLKELMEAGFSSNNIRFVAGTGLHGVMSQRDFIRKLGKDVVGRFPVYNHNAFGNCAYVGTTSTYKTKVSINEEVLKCDFKIAIGSVVPHHLGGFSGGGKIVLPGVASYNSIQHNHVMGNRNRMRYLDKSCMGMGIFDNNPLRRDIDEGAMLVGIDFVINAIVNKLGETVAIYAGDMVAAHAAAVEDAKTHYFTPKAQDNNIVIANIFSINNIAAIGLIIAFPSVTASGGDVVLNSNYPEGPVPHYLGGRWGRDTWASHHGRLEIPKNVNRLIVYDKYPQPGTSWFDDDERIVYFSKWEHVIKLLKDSHSTEAKVAVYPNSEIQYSR